MSALFNQTNIAPGTTNFITRAEVIQGFSTLAGDLSGVNFSTFFLQPNPVVSTLTVNPSGTISLPGSINTQILNLSSVSQILPVAPQGTTQFLGIGVGSATGVNSVFQDFYAKNHFSQNTNTKAQGDKINYSYQGIYGLQGGVNAQPLAVWNSGAPSGSNWTLANVSSINGVQPGAFNNFTSITGSNITLNGNLLAPQMTGLSSINGVPYSAVYTGSYNFSGSVTAPANGTAALVYSIPLPAGYLQPNTTYIYDVPLVLTSFDSGQPTGFVCNIGLRLGNNGQINYQIPLAIFASTQGTPVNLTGIAQTNSTTIGSQTIDLVIATQLGATFTATWSAPSSAGGLNVFTIKPLS